MTGGSTPALYTEAGRARLPALLDDLDAQGWLLYDMGDQNPLAHRLMGLGKTTRRAFALFPAQGAPRLLHHAVEASAWRTWPGRRATYRSREELETNLSELLSGIDRVAMEHSPGSAVPTVDRVPGGILQLVRAAGVDVVSSGNLITAFHSLWSSEGRESHFAAARVVQATALAAFEEAARAIGRGRPMAERDLMEWIEDTLAQGGVTEQVACIVATGVGAADPHYDPRGRGTPLTEGSLVLVDLWGGLAGGGIPADQTWMGFLGSPEQVDPRQREVWEAVREARDGALAFLSRRAREGRAVQGWEVDEEARAILRKRGLEQWFSHRLGHSIDARLHGSGPNLDHLETRDERALLPGVGFSVEPGVYIPGEIGVRSEVNVLWSEDGPTVTTPDPQEELLFVPPR